MIATRSLSLPNVIAAHAVWTPDAEAVVAGDDRLTWVQLVERIDRIANGLRDRGLRKGDKVATLLDNSVELLELILGTIAAGGVIVPLSPLMARDSLATMIVNAEARYLFASADTVGQITPVRDALVNVAPDGFFLIGGGAPDWSDYGDWKSTSSSFASAVNCELDDSISILYTSGTTGVPKGMEHTHLARLLYPLGLGPHLKIGRATRAILTTPLYHNGTWTTLLPTLYAGGSVVILKKFSVAALQETVSRERCTHAFMVPTQLVMMLRDPEFHPKAVGSMEVIMVSGAPLSSQTFADIRQRLPDLYLCEIYGMGEGFMTFIGPADYALGKTGSVGRPILELDTDIQILGADDQPVAHGEIGEIVGTSALLLKGYYGDPVRTNEALWRDDRGRTYLRSGDLGRYDASGYLYIVGRKKDMIISGGVKIYSVDIEDIFMQHPDVVEAAALGIPHEKWGETPLLLAIRRPGATISAEELRDWGNARLGRTQRVSGVEFRASFPRNSLEKIMKREMREAYWQGQTRDIS
jgi:acyl-CoA synthetase (AMP-forming)/AMP-acid ligase II